jgi:hypothetical protein
MTRGNWLETLAKMKWMLSTFNRLVEALRSAPTEGSKGTMLHIMGRFQSNVRMPDLEEMSEPVPDEYKALIDDCKQAQEKLEQCAILSNMGRILTTIECLVDVVGTASLTEKPAVEREIERFRSEWLRMPNLEEATLSEVAHEYTTFMDRWERAEHKYQEWRLHEIPPGGSA